MVAQVLNLLRNAVQALSCYALQVKTAHALGVNDSGAEFRDFGAFKCTPAQIADMAQALEPHK